MKAIETDNAPPPIASYSQGVVTEPGKMIFTSGQLGLDPQTKEWGTSFIDQARLAIKNALAVVEAGGGTAGHVVKVNVWIKNKIDFDAFDKIYQEFFGESYPARAAMGPSWLPGVNDQALIEVEMMAVVPKKIENSGVA